MKFYQILVGVLIWIQQLQADQTHSSFNTIKLQCHFASQLSKCNVTLVSEEDDQMRN